jgi:hypothetical protein
MIRKKSTVQQCEREREKARAYWNTLMPQDKEALADTMVFGESLVEAGFFDRLPSGVFQDELGELMIRREIAFIER